MKRIYLSKRDKIVFNCISEEGKTMVDMPESELFPTLKYLESLGFVRIHNPNDPIRRIVRITDYGKKYKLENPTLKNPMPEFIKWLIPMIITTLLALFSAIK